MKKIKEYLKRYENFLLNIYDKGYFKSFSIKKPKESLLLLINFFPYFYLKPKIREEKNKHKTKLYFKLKKENNIKFGLWNNINVWGVTISQIFSCVFLYWHLILLVFVIHFFNKTDVSFNDLSYMFSPIDSSLESQYNKVDFDNNLYNLLKEVEKPIYQFKSKGEVTFNEIKQYYSENNLEAFNGYDDYPKNGSSEEKKSFIENKFIEEYQKENYTYIFSEENGNMLFEILNENKNLVLNEKLLSNKDIFYSFSENLSKYYNFDKIDNVFFYPNQSSRNVIKNNVDKESISFINVSYLNANNTFSKFLYKAQTIDKINLKSISIVDDKVRIFNHNNHDMNGSELFTAKEQIIKEFNKILIFYPLFFIWSVTTIPLFRKYLQKENLRRETVVFSSPYKNQLLLEDKREQQKIKQNKKVSVMNI
tara:strand:- start:8499 stop:9764 length:1266 start_codon:yes stop_codon:yes gene_type:complete